MVSIVAFQAVDPGSIPGRRTLLAEVVLFILARFFHGKEKILVLVILIPVSQLLVSACIHTVLDFIKRCWCNG